MEEIQPTDFGNSGTAPDVIRAQGATGDWWLHEFHSRIFPKHDLCESGCLLDMTRLKMLTALTGCCWRDHHCGLHTVRSSGRVARSNIGRNEFFWQRELPKPGERIEIRASWTTYGSCRDLAPRWIGRNGSAAGRRGWRFASRSALAHRCPEALTFLFGKQDFSNPTSAAF